MNKFNLKDQKNNDDFLAQLEKIAGPRKIKDRHIQWNEMYGERSEHLKERFDKVIGPGAYYRWDGHDYTTNSDYFIVVGPAIDPYGKKAFFSGIKKLPPIEKRKKVYAPYGEYFQSIMAALSHANQKWGSPIPPDQQNYSVNELANIEIPRHIKG